MELIKLAGNPRIMQAAKKFHQECANAGIHITKEVGSFQLSKGWDTRTDTGLAPECIRVIERQTERIIDMELID
jgi:hypothetical protein